MSAQNTLEPIAIWDFDGVLCDSLPECVAVTALASRMVEESGRIFSPAEIKTLCRDDVLAPLYLKLSPLRPYIIRGQDYLWQYFHYETFKPQIGRGMSEYQKVQAAIFSEAENKTYEDIFYAARKQVAAALGDDYGKFFRAYAGALDALRFSIAHCRTYICTNRDQAGVSALLDAHDISFPKARIFSKDFNGLEPNTRSSKTEQAFWLLETEGGRDQTLLFIEDQVKTPAEMAPYCAGLRTIYASYGYGLRNDWADAKLPHCTQITRADQLLPTLMETLSR